MLRSKLNLNKIYFCANLHNEILKQIEKEKTPIVKEKLLFLLKFLQSLHKEFKISILSQTSRCKTLLPKINISMA